MDRLARKFDPGPRGPAAARRCAAPGAPGSGVIAYGSSDPAVRESQDQLRAEAGLETDYLRVRAWPFSRAVLDFVAAHDRIYVVEQNRDGQLAALLKLDLAAGAGDPAPRGRPRHRAAARRPLGHRRDPRQGEGLDGRARHRRRRRPRQNRIGLTVLDYRGGKTTLCAGCGHNAISERILEACFDLGIPPERVAKFSGIGCSSKSPAYFLGRSHAFNSVHGRMPSVATGALLANRTCSRWASPATATPRPSASASSCTSCGATCPWST